MASNISIWIKLHVGSEDLKTSVTCDPSSTNIDDLKCLVKEKMAVKLSHLDAAELSVKDTQGEAIEEDVMLSDISEGRSMKTAFNIFAMGDNLICYKIIHNVCMSLNVC